MTKPRIVFMGTPDFAVPALRALLQRGEQVVAVVTQPDRRQGRGRKLSPPPVKELALAAGIPVLQPEKIKGVLVDLLRPLRPDLIIVAAYGRILPPDVLELPPRGCINIHGSLLPKLRGAAPIQRAILNGDTETGITTMLMAAGLDTGDILLSAALPISADDTSGTLFTAMADLGAGLLTDTLDALEAGTLTPRPQDDSLATLAPPLLKEEAVIDWQLTAAAVSCLIRGLDPWPLAYTRLGDKRLRLFRPWVIKGQSAPPGTIIAADKSGLLVACGSDALLIKEVQADGGKRMPVASFIQGRSLPVGERLGV
ncbi:MAG TPA: methionyl-tRNA formyltransferase [Desulfobacterales bacterium]|nr:methionyl-tRNA formyltransferase [Desulfobacterales bacterium]